MNTTRDKILFTAFSMFINDGYKAVSMSELVKRCGVTKGGIYHHFSGKEEIFKEILRMFFTPAIEKLVDDITTVDGTAIQRLEGLFKVYAETCSAVSAYPGLPELEYGVYYLMIEGSKYSPGFKEALSGLYDRLFAETEAIIRVGIAEKSFRKQKNPLLAARTIVSLAEGSYLLWIVNKNVPLADVFASAHTLAKKALLNR